MIRAALIVLALASPASAAIKMGYGTETCDFAATHVVVADDTGKVLESWRGDLTPGTVLPVAEFKLLQETEGGRRQKPDGKRLVLFLTKGGSQWNGRTVRGWSAAHFVGRFNVSTAWVDGGKAYGLMQTTNPGPLEFVAVGTEAEVKAKVRATNDAAEVLFRKARAEADLPKRAAVLAGILDTHPCFAPQAFAGLEWCGVAALPVLRAVLGSKDTREPIRLAAYQTLANLGEPARGDLVEACAAHAKHWGGWGPHIDSHGWGDEHFDQYAHLRAVVGNADAFRGATPDQRKTLTELRDVWAKHPVLSEVGEKGDRVTDHLDKALAVAGK